MSRNLFIAGTGTDVGKTFVTGLILKKLKQSGACAAYYKAAMSGNRPGTDGKPVPGDAVYVKEISGRWKKCAPMFTSMRPRRIWRPALREIPFVWSACWKIFMRFAGGMNM